MNDPQYVLAQRDQASVTREVWNRDSADLKQVSRTQLETLANAKKPSVARWLARSYLQLLDSQEQTIQQLQSELNEASELFVKKVLELGREREKVQQLQADKEQLIAAAIDLIDASQDARCADLRIVIARMREAIDAARGVQLAKEGTDAVA